MAEKEKTNAVDDSLTEIIPEPSQPVGPVEQGAIGRLFNNLTFLGVGMVISIIGLITATVAPTSCVCVAVML